MYLLKGGFTSLVLQRSRNIVDNFSGGDNDISSKRFSKYSVLSLNITSEY